jgi:hypothetical protein
VSSLTIQETQAIAKLAGVLYNFIPGSTFAPTGVKIDFGTVAHSVGLGHLWLGGSKQPAIEALLEGTLQTKRDKFCDLMIRIVQEGIKYRNRKKQPITKEEIQKINNLIAQLHFKIPELHNPDFIAKLPTGKLVEERGKDQTKSHIVNLGKLAGIKNEFMKIGQLQPRPRGYAFEKFLHELFETYNFTPKPSFRIQGEQIDGSISFDHEFYLLEAKWQNEADILVLDGRVQGHSTIGRGIFITAGCFSQDGIAAYQKLRPSSLVGIDGQDLYFVLDKFLPLEEVLQFKIRRLVETGEFHYPVSRFITQLKL